jgi:hypothetical protein
MRRAWNERTIKNCLVLGCCFGWLIGKERWGGIMCVECVRRLSLWLNGEASPVQLVASWSWRCGVEHQLPRTPDHKIFRSNWISFPKIFSVKTLDVRFLPYHPHAPRRGSAGALRWSPGRWQEHAGDVAGGRARAVVVGFMPSYRNGRPIVHVLVLG